MRSRLELGRSPGSEVGALAELLALRWGVSGELTEIGSFEDRNFLVETSAERFVLRLSKTSPESDFELEHAAMRRLAEPDFPYAVPAVVPPVTTDNHADGEATVGFDGHLARLLTWVPGKPLSEAYELDESTLAAIGQLTASTVCALHDLPLTGRERESSWDPRHARNVIDELAGELPESQRGQLTRAVQPLVALDPAVRAALPMQVIHGDITDFNLVREEAGTASVAPTGLIDFGDTVLSWRVCEPAATCVAIAARFPHDPLTAILTLLSGYRDVAELTVAEVDALWPVILARAAACACLSDYQLQSGSANRYLIAMNALDRVALDALAGLPEGLAPAAFRSLFGLPPIRRNGLSLSQQLAALSTAPILPGVTADRLGAIDRSMTSQLPREDGWDQQSAMLGTTAGQSCLIAVGRWGEVRLDQAGSPSPQAPATLHLGVDLFVGSGCTVCAPCGCEVTSVGDDELVLSVQLAGQTAYIRLAGVGATVTHGQQLTSGQAVGTVAARADGSREHMHLQVCHSADSPGLVVPREHEREAWLALCPDPSPLIGIDAAAPLTLEPTVARYQREQVLASSQRLYYAHPPVTVRGWRQFLYDSDGRPYLDMINNVAAVGHSHPRVTAAASRQFQLLNTNSRFLYESMTRLAERLVALLPDALDTIFLVNSGSEACDLAIQLARVYTGRRDLLVLAGAYHGWTETVYELCTSPADNPGWRETIPNWVHVAPQPDPYRGALGSEAEPYVAALERALADAEGHGGPAAFICEPLLGNQGAVEPPAGYVEAAYAAVRSHGGLCIADEIQVGYGRTGPGFWAFEHEGVVPDIVIAAKAAGNGHPIGIVACRRGIADAIDHRAPFFSSTGGCPVTCEIGLAVLDVMRDERLPENAATIGSHLKAGLGRLAVEHSAVGAVHGRGLYLGVDLVRDRITREPWAELAKVVCERMRQRGVIIQPTGDAGNVLKVKPPLCINEVDADYFVVALEQVLRESMASLAGSM